METIIEKLPQSKIKLTIKVSSPEMRGFFSRAYNKLAANVEVKGFRAGMAPKSLIIAAISENRLNSEILDLALQETYSETLKREKILPITSPKINIKMVKDLTVDTAELEYEAEFDVLPEVKIGDYKNLKIKTKRQKDHEIKVADDEVDQILSHLQRQKATFKDIDRSLKQGDRVEINFEGFEKGVKLENLSSQHYPVILGSGSLVPDFEKNLIGLKKNDKKEFKVELVDQKDLKQPKKPIDFKVEILETQEVILPKIDDTFAKNFEKDTLEDLKKAISDDIILQKKEVQKKTIENQVLEELIKITTVEIPESLIKQETDRQINLIREKVVKMGMAFEKYLENAKKSEEDFRKDLELQAGKTVKIGLGLGEIVKLEKIDLKDKQAGKIALEKLIKYATQ